MFEALLRCGKSDRLLDRFDACGLGAAVYRHEKMPHVLRVRSDTCRNRWCPSCAKRRGGILRSNLEALAATSTNRLKMLTLTLRHSTRDLRPQVDRLTNCFRQLRRLDLWTKHVRAACWVLEVKVGQDRKWHAHLHVLLDSKYIPHADLSRTWLALTGDSYIVDIRPMSASHGARYVAKYVSKPVDQTVASDQDRLQEAITAMHGKRSCATLGKWRQFALAKRDTAKKLQTNRSLEDDDKWIFLSFYDQLEQDARNGDVAALRTMDLIHNHKQEALCRPPRDPMATHSRSHSAQHCRSG